MFSASSVSASHVYEREGKKQDSKRPGLPHFDVDVFARERSFKEWKLLACLRHTQGLKSFARAIA
jgi:hypothetical protein